MYPPPEKSIVAKLEGGVIDTVTFARCGLHFTLEDEKNGFSVTSPFCFGRADSIRDMSWIDFPLGRTEIPRILASTIVSARTEEDYSLRIEFSTGDLLLVAWTPVCESYELRVDGSRIIV